MSLYSVSGSPHITTKRNTKSIMLHVIIALMPALIASWFIYGIYPLVVALLSVVSCVSAEFIYCLLTKRTVSIGDFSAVVTGLILALNLPPVVPLYVPVVGGYFAVMIVKMLFGGIGRNFANPAATARIFLLLAWPAAMTRFVVPIDLSSGIGEMFKYFTLRIDTVTGATPLALIAEGNLTGINLLDMFLGRIGGSAGEVSALAVLIGGIYLIAVRVIDWKIPVTLITTVILFTWIFYGDAAYILPSVLGGGLLFGAFFMATDYATSPNTPVGTLIFAFGIGFITVLVRKFGGMNEGVSFAIVLMNIVVPLLDKYIRPTIFGHRRVKKIKSKKQDTNGEAAS